MQEALKNILSPTELFDYRLAALHGWLDIEAMKASMPQRVYLGWQRYFAQEPWGTFRDNLHAAIVAREIRRLNGRARSADKLSPFMVKSPVVSAVEAKDGVLTALGAMAKPVSPKEAQKRMRAAKKLKATRKAGKK